MSDWSSEFAGDISILERNREEREARLNFRSETWTTKDKREILIKNMDDSHLLNAYKYSQRDVLFREMVLRLFEERVMQ